MIDDSELDARYPPTRASSTPARIWRQICKVGGVRAAPPGGVHRPALWLASQSSMDQLGLGLIRHLAGGDERNENAVSSSHRRALCVVSVNYVARTRTLDCPHAWLLR